MKPEWTGQMVGKMHVNGVTYEELGEELGIGKAYVCMILNGSREPDGVQEKFETAIETIIKRKQEAADG